LEMFSNGIGNWHHQGRKTYSASGSLAATGVRTNIPRMADSASIVSRIGRGKKCGGGLVFFEMRSRGHAHKSTGGTKRKKALAKTQRRQGRKKGSSPWRLCVLARFSPFWRWTSGRSVAA
jgi:hypothetical protein